MTLDECREDVIAAFPSSPFRGVFPADCNCDECCALRLELPGKRWDEIPSEFIDFNSGSLPLMQPDALVAFLPAWLLRSMERLGESSVLSEFTMYFFCPGNDEDERNEERIAKRVSLFDDRQRRVICCYLEAIASSQAFNRWHTYAEFGLRRWRA